MSFQQGLANFVNSSSNNGNAIINTPQLERPDWDVVKKVLNGELPVSDLGCK